MQGNEQPCSLLIPDTYWWEGKISRHIVRFIRKPILLRIFIFPEKVSVYMCPPLPSYTNTHWHFADEFGYRPLVIIPDILGATTLYPKTLYNKVIQFVKKDKKKVV